MVAVVPTVATTAAGRTPAATSAAMAAERAPGSIRNSASVGIFRRLSVPIPSATTALSTEEWAWSDV